MKIEKKKSVLGLDEMTALRLRPYLEAEWSLIKQSLLEGTYTPKTLKRVEIPKESGGVRLLGIP